MVDELVDVGVVPGLVVVVPGLVVVVPGIVVVAPGVVVVVGGGGLTAIMTELMDFAEALSVFCVTVKVAV